MNQKTKDDLFMARGLGNEPYSKNGRILLRTNAPYYNTATYRLLVDATGKKLLLENTMKMNSIKIY